MIDFKSFDKIFHILCLLITGGMVSWCLYNYCLDLDVCLVDQKAFGEEDNYITPALSFCFYDPVVQKKLDQNYPGINKILYTKFLNGKHWDDKMLDIDFETVSLSLEDFIVIYRFVWDDGTHKTYSVSDFSNYIIY